MKLQYAWISTGEPDFSMQIEALRAASCDCDFADSASGAPGERAELASALSHFRANDVLVLWRLDEAARLQSFCDGFIVHGSERQQLKQLGNAAPPLMGLAVARAAKSLLQASRAVEGK